MKELTTLHIGYDAKRAYFNRSGLGNYSRDLIRIMSHYLPHNQYLLFKHKDLNPLNFEIEDNTRIILPHNAFYTKMGSLWRSYGMSQSIKQSTLDIYHGLSQELPIGIEKTGVKSVVSIHDCIFLRYPELFDLSYRIIFKKKYQHACEKADRIIAISEQTKRDIIHYFKVPQEKIDVVYQGCNRAFYEEQSAKAKAKIKAKYQLPDEFILNVGTIEERKNVLSIFKAIAQENIDIPVVVIGRETDYAKKVKQYVKKQNLKAQFIHDADFADFPAIYQQASIFAYPSLFEGFGIPILEALNSGTPVITTAGGVFPEVGGDAAQYVKYGDTNEMAQALISLLNDPQLRAKLALEGKKQALKFREKEIAEHLMNVYHKALS